MENNSRTLSVIEMVAAVEEERLHGADTDPFICLSACQILQRVVRKAGICDIHDDDFWDTIAFYMTQLDLQELMINLFPNKAERFKYRNENLDYYKYRPSIFDTLKKLFDNLLLRKPIWKELDRIMEKRIVEYRQMLDDSANLQTSCTFKARLDELQSLLGLKDRDVEILILLYLQQDGKIDLGDFRVRNKGDFRKIALATGLSEQEVAESLSLKGILHKFGIVDDDADINWSFMSFLRGISNEPLSERFWTKFEGEALPWEFHGVVAERHGNVIMDMVNGKTDDVGLSVLLYGCAGAGKTSFAISLAKRLGKDVYFIAQNKNDDDDNALYSANFRYAALAAAQRQLNPQKSILVIDECDDMLESYEAGIFGFGRYTMKKDGAEAKGQLNAVMDDNRHTVIWICNSQQDSISASSRRRFDYSVLFDELLPETRAHIWENCLARHGYEGMLSDEFIRNVSNKYKVNAGGVAIAIKNAVLVHNSRPEKDFGECVMQFLLPHCSLLGISPSCDDRLEPAKDYTLDGLNIHANLHLERIVEVCRHFLEEQDRPGSADRDRPRMNLLLHGVPGSGKTEFVKYLAKQIGKKLNIKNASDLLSCYVGGTEHLLAEAFAEAERNHEILFIDEGDSMLSSRSSAHQSWEVSQVNTLLTEMENFNGVFIVGTNLIQRLDPAAIRRFTFKIHFDFLKDDGKLKFYDTYFHHLGLPAMTDDERNALFAISRLTPSDFRNVRQQFFYLSASDLSNTEIIDALRQEAASRDSQGDFKNLGEEKHGIGFGNF